LAAAVVAVLIGLPAASPAEAQTSGAPAVKKAKAAATKSKRNFSSRPQTRVYYSPRVRNVG
jgi:hypothetical protein